MDANVETVDPRDQRAELIERVWRNMSNLPTTKSPCRCGRAMRSASTVCLVCCQEQLAALTNGQIAEWFIMAARSVRQIEMIVRDGPDEGLPSASSEDRQAAVDLVWRVFTESTREVPCPCGRGGVAQETLLDEPRCTFCLGGEVSHRAGVDAQTAATFVWAVMTVRKIEKCVLDYSPELYGRMTEENSVEDFAPEPGICVCCKAATEGVIFIPPTLKYPVCQECGSDGSFHKFLVKEFEEALKSEDGNKTAE